MRNILLLLANAIRQVRRWIVATLALALLLLNLLTVSIVGVFEAVRGVVFGIAEAVSLPVEAAGWRQSLDEKNRFREERDDATAKLRAARADIARLEEDLADARLVNEQHQARIEGLKGERERLASRANAADARVQILEEDLAAERAAHSATREELKKAITRPPDPNPPSARAGSIIARIQARTMRVAGRNILAEPATAIPIVGSLGVGALLAYELGAACETVRDLAALSEELDLQPPEDSPSLDSGLSCAEIAREYIRQHSDDRKVACFEARAKTGELDPPECAGIPLPSSDGIAEPQVPVPEPAPPPSPDPIDLPDHLQ